MTTKVMDCDLLVLGAGGSGLVAGSKAFDLTGKKVIILEKSKKPAGCTYFASGMGESGPIRDSKWQKDAGVKVNEDPQDISGQFFDWLVTATTKEEAEKFFSIAKAGDNARGGVGSIKNLERTEKYKNLPDHSIGPGRMGSWVVDHLTDYCKKKGIQILTETRARKFITDDKGRVSGVIADNNDGQLLVNCKACIIAAGGYGRNMDLLKKYYPKLFNGKKIHSLCPPAMTGDGILAAEEIGAYIDPTIRSLSFPGGFFGDGMMRHPWNTNLQRLQSGKCVIINMNGKRWKNEAGMGGGDIAEQPDGVACAIVDSTIVEAADTQQSGSQFGGSDPRTLKEDLESEAAMDDAGASGNHTKKADSLVELALKMKVDPRALVDTIERYNKFCETGKDLDFGKSAQMLQPIKTPPFYAIFGHRWSQSTKGRNGIAVNSRFEALNTKGEAIPGLYAVGDGCTIFGGFVIGTPNGGTDPLTAEETAARTSLSRDVAQAFAAAPSAGSQGMGGPGQGAPGGQGGASGAGTLGGQGGMPMMGGGAQNADILKGKGSPCGGLGPAFLSGYCAGTFAAKYIKSL
jgi:fumarate reductase flavoprotein subunit